MAAAHIFQPSARGCDPSAFLPTLTPSGPAEDLAEVTAMLEHVAGALQEVLVAFGGGEMTEVDRCGRAIAAHRALALVSRVRSEESRPWGGPCGRAAHVLNVWSRGRS
jgi:hypothetical protein